MRITFKQWAIEMSLKILAIAVMFWSIENGHLRLFGYCGGLYTGFFWWDFWEFYFNIKEVKNNGRRK